MIKGLIPRIGISGWRYEPWRGTFYPAKLPQKDELAYASRQLNSIEINGSFYSLQRPSSWKNWYEETPPGFQFSIKGSRFITHIRRLNNIDEPLANFFSQGFLALEEKLGPFLWQFPPNFQFDGKRLEAFFEKLPRDTDVAVKLASQHSAFMKGRTFFQVKGHHALRHAIEIRHESFNNPEFIALLRRQNIGLVVADTAGKWPFLEDLTSDFVYARLHGDEVLYTSGYTTEALDEWAKRIHAWQHGKEVSQARHASTVPAKRRKSRQVFVYFDNDVKVRSPFDAMALAEKSGGFVAEGEKQVLSKAVKGAAREHWPAIRGPKSSKK